jgi:hypothetical protein
MAPTRLRMTFSRRLASACAAFALAWAAAPSLAALAPADAARAADLRDRYAQVRARLEASPYGRPLWLDSREMDRELQGDAYAVVAQPYARVEAALAPVDSWCEVLMLPFNTKHCVAASDGGGGAQQLSLFVGRKSDTPLASTYRLDFDYTTVARGRDYLQLALKCGIGPLGTRDYRIVLEATPIDAGHTFLHLGYNYAYGTVSKVAMQAYLATVGASKVGFSTDGADGDGQPRLVRGMRGVMERNTMRYFLAIDAYLGSLDGPREARVMRRLNDWFSAAERYPRQLHEDIGRGEYLAMKQREFARVARAARTAAGS